MLGGFRTTLGRTSQIVPTIGALPTPPPFISKDKAVFPQKPMALFPRAASDNFLSPRVSSGPGQPFQVRFSHTDLRSPTFDAYRRPATRDANASARDSEEGRKAFAYASTAATAVVGAYTAKSLVTKIVAYYMPARNVLAMSTVEVDLSGVPEGKSVTVTWRGKPLFVRHRTAEEIEGVKGVSGLRDQEEDDVRVKDSKYLIVLGVCTHLGCVPIAGAGEFGGYYCPCHGSHYDASGRIRKGPAPLNLEVPPYKFLTPTLVLVGSEE